MDTLGKLFGSVGRVKTLRYLLAALNPAFEEIAKVTRIKSSLLKKELKLLESIGLVKTKGKKFLLNQDFPLLTPLKEMLIALPERNDLCRRIGKFGKIKLLLTAGTLLGIGPKRVDLLVVGDKLKKKDLEKLAKKLEIELGRPIDFALLDTPDFLYRLSMYDKFLADVLNFPHEMLICAPELSTKLKSA